MLFHFVGDRSLVRAKRDHTFEGRRQRAGGRRMNFYLLLCLRLGDRPLAKRDRF
ncbi:hypothetical protein LC593_35855 [Nostoc sp. CHAB 5844]|nr:hypothetical protein [Nostoc sp. CHAB 5844]